MTNIRPHHLLCMRAFIGKGYSKEFTDNMRTVISRIQNEKEVNIVFHPDDICAQCPHLEENRKCKTENSTLLLDDKVVEIFKIQQRVYSVDEIALFVKNMTKDDFARICSTCSWYPSGICEGTIFNPGFTSH